MRASDVERFYSHVLKGPHPGSCWLWVGAISDDGYGRFWIGTAGGQRAVAAHRFALATVHGGLAAIKGMTALHWCDVPLCVRASLEPTTHLLLGTPEENMADRARKNRMPSPNAVKWRRLSRAERSARSRGLRDALKTGGWDEDLVRELVHGIDPDHPTLF
ncbi:hypothetical protein GCM10011374_39000 [Kocuria dechangensis]|uniref:HNH endonuclease n=1 Tax=Kocuria dechangensis TaxID=1176249 RepID=A0A917H8G6_9MICC|nr:hypothetical protein [Kocuria dechangensis]GGG70621.1 hypothetical protein GCM10011374_39000 [Kocuria dechangensis]